MGRLSSGNINTKVELIILLWKTLNILYPSLFYLSFPSGAHLKLDSRCRGGTGVEHSYIITFVRKTQSVPMIISLGANRYR